MGNREKSSQLGMPFGTACSRLRKMLLFHLLEKHGENVCYRCGERIISVDELSVDHKKPWFKFSTDLFWDLRNIAFSHLTCNVDARNKTSAGHANRPVVREGTCSYCERENLPPEMFSKNVNRWNGRSTECKDCRRNR